MAGLKDSEKLKDMGIATRALHAGWRSDPATGAFCLPIYGTAGYEFRDASHAADLFALKEHGYIYSRLGNPTVAAFEEAIASVEGGSAAVATSSGQAAFTLLIMALASAGDHIVAAGAVYGGTITLLKNLFSRYGVEVDFVDFCHPCGVQAAVRENTKAIICEVIGNPAMSVAPLESISTIAKREQIPFIVDNTFSPIVCAPFKWGADIIVHSTTKYISGQGNVIGGAIVDSGNFDWSADARWASLNAPDAAYHGVVFTEQFGKNALTAKIKTSILRDVGACPSAFDCYLLRSALGTLPLRMKRHSESALEVARFLESHPAVEWVSYPGLPSHEQYDLAKQYLENGASGMMAFELKGGYEAGVRFLDRLGLFANVANVGDGRSMALHSASTTHYQLTPEERLDCGISEGMIRLSVGLEDACDLISDLDEALRK